MEVVTEMEPEMEMEMVMMMMNVRTGGALTVT